MRKWAKVYISELYWPKVERLHLCCLLGGERNTETQRGCFNSLIGAMIIDKDDSKGEEGNVIGCHKGI